MRALVTGLFALVLAVPFLVPGDDALIGVLRALTGLVAGSWVLISVSSGLELFFSRMQVDDSKLEVPSFPAALGLRAVAATRGPHHRVGHVYVHESEPVVAWIWRMAKTGRVVVQLFSQDDVHGFTLATSNEAVGGLFRSPPWELRRVLNESRPLALLEHHLQHLELLQEQGAVFVDADPATAYELVHSLSSRSKRYLALGCLVETPLAFADALGTRRVDRAPLTERPRWSALIAGLQERARGPYR